MDAAGHITYEDVDVENSVAVVESNVSESNGVNNVSSVNYFSRDLSCVLWCVLDERQLENKLATCFLASSSHIDLLTLFHERTGHCNKRTLIEGVKSKLFKGLKLKDKDFRKFSESDKHVCDICARAKMTRMVFNKIHAIRGVKVGDYISVDIAVFINCPSREGFKYVACFVDHEKLVGFIP